MIEWSKRALSAIPLLFRQLQDIEVYVEDDSSDVFYLELLNRLGGDKLKIDRVFCLGGKEAVVDKCAAHDFKARPALFLIDGDLPWVRGELAPEMPGLFRLDAYCVENFLMCENAATEFMYDGSGAETRRELQSKLAWIEWLKSEVEVLVPLFVMYATANKLRPDIPTVSEGVGKFIKKTDKGLPVLNTRSVARRVDELRAQLKKEFGDDAVEATHEAIHKRAENLPSKIDIVSGKDFLLPLLRHRCNSIVRQAPNNKAFYIRLARHFELTRLTSLGVELRRAAAQ